MLPSRFWAALGKRLQLEPLAMVSEFPGRAGEEIVPKGPLIQEVPLDKP